MAIADDFSVAVNGDVRYTGTTANYTVLELHRFLQDLADNASSAGDDLLDITDETPSDRSTDNIVTLQNGYNIDDTAATHLYDGSITQDNGATIYAGLVVVGSVEAGTNVIIVQDNALLSDTWSSVPNDDAANNIILRNLVKVRSDGADIDGRRIIVMAREFGDTYAEFSVTMGLGNNTAALFTSADLNNQTAQGTVNAWVITNTEGFQQIDVTGDGSDEDYYSQWDLGVQGINDLYEFGKDIQRRGTAETIHGMSGALFRGITHQWAYDGEAGTSPATNDEYVWGAFLDHGAVTGGPFVVGEVVTGGTSNAVGRILSVDGTNTSLVVATESGTWQNGEVLTGTTSSATATTSAAPVGQATGGGVLTILAVDDNGTTGTVWGQLIKGTAPGDNAVCYDDGGHTATLTVNGSVTSRTVQAPFIGASTGSAIIGAFGIGIDPTDLSASDQLFDLTNTLRIPPNNVVFTVAGLVSGEDRVLVGPEDGAGGLDLDQLALNTTLIGATETSIVCTASIPTDTPSSGTIRVELDDGTYRLQSYTSFTGSTFTIPSTDYSGGNAATSTNNIFISYIDKLAGATSENFTVVYASDRTVFVRVRDGGGSPIKTFETTGTVGSAGGSATAIRTTDA
jgi:hypothetical protein